MPKHVRWLCGIGIAGVLLVATMLGLRVSGLARPFVVPTNTMAPTINRFDHVIFERLSLLMREPRRGEIVAFTVAHIPTFEANSPNPNEIYIKRLAGLPGEHLRIENERLLVNGSVPPEFKNQRCTLIQGDRSGLDLNVGCVVPPDCYFVVGDNTENSYDSRYWGFLPKADLKMVYFCHYWRSPKAQK